MLELFEKTVMQTVEKNKAIAINQIQNEYKTALEEALQTAAKAAGERVFAEQYGITLRNNKRTAQALNHAKQTLAEIRNALIDRLFDDVKNDLLTFVSTDEYPLFFQKKLTARREGSFMPMKNCVVMERDASLVPPELNLSVETTRDDFIGGFKLSTHDRRVFADFTLLSAWEKQRENFSALYSDALKAYVFNE
jgi:vacuolar-type H+-ATPase subunit E/Vma4